MTRIYLITGQMRSGTSLVAKLVHHLGYPIGSAIHPPVPPHWESDWEDQELSWKLMDPDTEPPDAEWFRGYFNARHMHSQALGVFRGVWAAKHPHLALFARQAEEAAHADGFDLRWIVTERPQEAINASMRRHPYLDTRINGRIHARLGAISRGHLVKTHFLQDPQLQSLEIGALAEALEIEDPWSEEIVEAMRPLIRTRRSLTPWLQLPERSSQED